MKSLTPEQLASGEWVWEDSLSEFVHIDDLQDTGSTEETTVEEQPEKESKTKGGKWNGNKFV